MRNLIPSPADAAFKTLFRALIERAGGLDAAAAASRVGRSTLAGYYDPNSPHFAPCDVVAALERVTGEPLLTAELARRAGCRLVEIEPASAGLLACSERAATEGAQAHVAVLRGLADGKLSPDEMATIERESMEAAEAYQRLAASVRRANVEAR